MLKISFCLVKFYENAIKSIFFWNKEMENTILRWLNNNIRCIEMEKWRKNNVKIYKLNNDIRCIEICQRLK